jgi:hypothetical protein
MIIAILSCQVKETLSLPAVRHIGRQAASPAPLYIKARYSRAGKVPHLPGSLKLPGRF